MGLLTASMAWQGGVAFEGVSSFGHKVRTDIKKEAGGDESGVRPTELLLYAIASCTGVDVVRILEKQRQELTSLEIEISAHQRDDYPKWFDKIEVRYIATGKRLDPEKLAQAIELSEGKYCSVSQTVKNQGEIVTAYEVREG